MLGLVVPDSLTVGQLATLITAAGVGIYVLGLIGLALAIRLTFAESWSTAWYAASLMPRTIVAGQGMWLWVGGSLVALIQSLFWFVALAEIVFHPQPYDPRLLSIIALFGIAALLVGSMLYVTRVSAKERMAKSTRRGLQPILLPLGTAIGMSVMGSLITVSAIYTVLRALEYRASESGGYAFTVVFRTTVANWDALATGGLLFLLGVFVWGVPLTDSLEAPLPMVKIIEKPEQQTRTERGEAETQQAPVVVDGWLVAHTNSCWHLFVGEQKLVSIPDDRVMEAQVYDPQEDVEWPWWRRWFSI